MKLTPTKRTDYGIRALICLASHQGEHVTLHLMDCRIIGIAKPSRARRHHLLPALQKGA